MVSILCVFGIELLSFNYFFSYYKLNREFWMFYYSIFPIVLFLSLQSSVSPNPHVKWQKKQFPSGLKCQLHQQLWVLWARLLWQGESQSWFSLIVRANECGWKWGTCVWVCVCGLTTLCSWGISFYQQHLCGKSKCWIHFKLQRMCVIGQGWGMCPRLSRRNVLLTSRWSEHT